MSESFALYQGAIMVRLIERTIINGQRIAKVVFDNGEEAVVPDKDIAVLFDLMEGCEA